MMMTRQSHSTLIIVALVSGLLILHQVFSTTINSQQQLLQTEKKETPRLFPHILCLGDSLTEGYTSHGSQRHPYTNRLAERLENASYTASITQAGLSGDMVTEGFKPRLQRYYDSIDSIKYSLTIILGGINDIFRRGDSKDIKQSLKELYDMARNHGSRVLAMTLLKVDRNEQWTEELERRRQEVNEWIINAPKEDPNIIGLIDLNQLIPPSPLDYDDGLHLTTVGYDRVGDLIADFLLKQRSGV